MLFLQILKWIIIIISGILLFLVLSLLFFSMLPIRYEIKGEFGDKKVRGKGNVRWCFRAVRIFFVYDTVLEVKVKLLGKLIYNSLKEEEEKRNKKAFCIKRKKEQKKKDKAKKTAGNFSSRDDSFENKEDVEKSHVLQEKSTVENRKNTEESKNNYYNNESDFSQRGEKNSKIFLKIRSLTYKAEKWKTSFQNTREQISYYYSLWMRKETQSAFLKAKDSFIKLMKAFLPKNWMIAGKVGFEDPALTGEIMGIISVCYPYFGKHVDLQFNFEEEILETKAWMKGKIRPFYLIFHIILFFTNRHVLRFIKMIKNSNSDKDD